MNQAMRPLPQITSVNRPFWDACQAGRLDLQRCGNAACGKYVYYPRVCCPHCQGGELSWTTVSGKGVIESFTKVYRPQHEVFHAEVPIYFLAIRLAEGPLLYSRFEPGHTPEAEDAHLVGKPVCAVFSPPYGEIRLPYVRLQS